MNRYKMLAIIGLIAIVLIGAILILKTVPTSAGTTTNQQQGQQKSDVLVIRDNMFMATMSDMCTNPTDYENKKVEYEGFVYSDGDSNFVVRSYYCCGTDSYYVGLECFLDGEFPANNEWVKVEGTIKVLTDESGTYPFVEADSVTVMETRGSEFVY